MLLPRNTTLLGLTVLMLTALIATPGCGGCSSPQTPEAPPPAVSAEDAAEEVVELAPEDPPRDEDDAACRDFLREHANVLEIMGEAPRLAFESQAEASTSIITTYSAQSPTRSVRFRILWNRGENGELIPQGLDCQYRDGAAFQRVWTPEG